MVFGFRGVRGRRPDGYWQCQNGTGQYEGYSTPCYKVQSTETYQWAATKKWAFDTLDKAVRKRDAIFAKVAAE